MKGILIAMILVSSVSAFGYTVKAAAGGGYDIKCADGTSGGWSSTQSEAKEQGKKNCPNGFTVSPGRGRPIRDALPTRAVLDR